ncbi:MAG: tRNA threonylcarbamoyladenosine biosynthesis protein TsaE [Alphaproteobacteria bacterium]|jgi:tRNA threonylcarbamoyladenosine biosynthesis protein TsaE
MIYKIPLYTLDDTQGVAMALIDDFPQLGIATFSGKMGAGKTTFISYFIQALYKKYGQIPPIVTSPTFAIIHEYDVADFKIAHFDLFRLENPHDLINIGFDDYQENALCLIEWAENAEQYLDKPFLECHFEVKNDIRYLTLTPYQDYSLDNQKFDQFMQ